MTTRAVNILLNGKDNASKAFASVRASLNSLTGSIFNMRNAITGAFAGVGFGMVAKEIVSLTATMEQNEVAFATLLGGMDQAKKVLSDLRVLAKESPLEFPELADATKQLVAYGFAQHELLPTMKRLGDVSAALNAPIGELAYLYGTARVQGRAYARDILQFSTRGIPVIGELAKQFKVSEAEVSKLVEAGKIGFPAIEKAFIAMTGEGGKFHGMMKNQAATLGGQWAKLKDELKELAVQIGNALLPDLKLTVAMTSELTAGFKDWAAGSNSSISSMMPSLESLAGAIAVVADVWDVVRIAFVGMQKLVVDGIWTITGMIQKVLDVAGQLPDKLGGDVFREVAADMRLVREELAKASAQLGDEGAAMLVGRSSGEKVREFFDRMRGNVAEQSKTLAENLASKQDTGAAFVGVGKRVGMSVIEGIQSAFKNSGFDLSAIVFGSSEKDADGKKDKGLMGKFSSFAKLVRAKEAEMRKDLAKQAREAREENMLPQEKLEYEMEKLRGMRNLNLLDDADLKRAEKRLRDEILGKANDGGAPLTESRFLTRAPGQGSPMQEANQHLKKIATGFEKQVGFLGLLPEISNELKRQGRDNLAIAPSG